jgi:hypothetical protein
VRVGTLDGCWFPTLRRTSSGSHNL